MVGREIPDGLEVGASSKIGVTAEARKPERKVSYDHRGADQNPARPQAPF